MTEIRQYNPLPKDYKGEQKRKIDFASPQEQLAYDGVGLLDLAKRTYRREVVTVAEALDLRKRTNPESGADDDVEGLRREMAIKLCTKPSFESFVAGLDLPEASREKLRAMLAPQEYESAVATYVSMRGTKAPPTRDQIAAEIMTWPVERLRLECEMREKPTLLIVTDNSFDNVVQAMNNHKQHTNAKSEDQEDAYVNTDADSPYSAAPKPKKNRVSITDGVVHPQQLKGVAPKLGERRDQLTAEYAKVGMRHIDLTEQAALLRKSLREARKAEDNNLIVDNDNWGKDEITLTIINPDSLAKSKLVAYARFNLISCRVRFDANDPDHKADFARGRATVKVLEF